MTSGMKGFMTQDARSYRILDKAYRTNGLGILLRVNDGDCHGQWIFEHFPGGDNGIRNLRESMFMHCLNRFKYFDLKESIL